MAHRAFAPASKVGGFLLQAGDVRVFAPSHPLVCVSPAHAVLSAASGIAVPESMGQLRVSLTCVLLTLQACVLVRLGQKHCCSVLVGGCVPVCANTNYTTRFRFKGFHPLPAVDL